MFLLTYSTQVVPIFFIFKKGEIVKRRILKDVKVASNRQRQRVLGQFKVAKPSSVESV